MNMEELNNLIIFRHNPNLIDRKLSPNANTIYHLYSDGTITYQKGGDAYGQRSMFDLEHGFYSLKKKFKFPLVGGEDTYAILTKEECLEFRKEMVKYI